MKAKVTAQRVRCKVKQNLRTESAFTLIEIVISISILSVIMTITYSGMTQILRAKNILDDRRETNSVAYSLINRITREFQLAYSGIGLLPDREVPDGPQKPSDYNMVGENKSLSNGKRGDSITFVALEGGQYLPDGGTHSGLVQITYRVAEDPDRDESLPKQYLLIREETPHPNNKSQFERAFAKTMIFPVTENLISLEYRYYDPEKEEFLDAWDPEQNRKLPSQLEIKLELVSPAGELNSYITTVPLRSIN